MKKLVLDTNILVASAYAPGSASRRIVEQCLYGEFVAVTSDALNREYEFILARAVRSGSFQKELKQLLAAAQVVEPVPVVGAVPDDPDDDKLLAAALGGKADAVITNDRHLLPLDPWNGIRILRPAEFAGKRNCLK